MAGTVDTGIVPTAQQVNANVVGAAVALQIQKGIATLVGGTVTVTGVTLAATSRIVATANTTGGTQGILAIPVASRSTSLGQFVINSSQGSDTSTVEWLIIG